VQILGNIGVKVFEFKPKLHEFLFIDLAHCMLKVYKIIVDKLEELLDLVESLLLLLWLNFPAI